MARRQRIGVAQSQRLQLNTALQTALSLLRMDAGGLTRYLEEQAEGNPYLSVAAAPVEPGAWTPRWTSALRPAAADPAEAPQPGPSLMAHVLRQIETLTRSERERAIALVLAEAIEPSGWLGRPIAALAAEARCSPAGAEAVLARLQQMEPTGLFARSLQECLRLQAAEAGRLDPVMETVLGRLDLLGDGRLADLARLCQVPEAEILARLRVIRSFDPKPGAQFDPGTIDAREPDLTVTKAAEGWQVTLNRSALPAVIVRPPDQRPADPAERDALARALGLRRMVEQRNAMLLRVAQEVIARQVAVLDAGLGVLRPLAMAEVAEALGLHESTVSRAVAGVALATPRGTWALRSLFGPRVGDSSAAAIRAEIVRLVAAEVPSDPLSDAELAAALAAAGRPVARRTVSKYREMLRIPRAGLRRRARRRR
jgi:RNA polymerase sigma-54 factor